MSQFCSNCRRIYFGSHECPAGGESPKAVSDRKWRQQVKDACNPSCDQWGAVNGSTGCTLIPQTIDDGPRKPCDIGYYHRQGRGCFADPPKYGPRNPQPTTPADGPKVLAEWHNPIESDLPFQIIIKSMLRWDCTERLVRTIKRFYPTATILIADDSWAEVPSELPPAMQRTIEIPGVHWWQIQEDYGLAASRNFLARCSTAQYVVNCDDDFVFTHETRIEDMVMLLDGMADVGVVCGQIRMDGRHAMNWNGTFRFDELPSGNRSLSIDRCPNEWQAYNDVWWRPTELSWNFLCARRDIMVDHPADEQFKIVGEHMDRFLMWQKLGIRVVECANVIVGHIKQTSKEYKAKRQRTHYHKDLRTKWGIEGNINHLAEKMPAMAPLDCTQAVRDALRERPNIVLMTVGHTGSTVVAKMLGALGWQMGDADDEYGESESVRACNIERRWKDTQAIIDALPEPWVIKDPRMCEHLPQWVDAMAKTKPALVWLTRDEGAVRASWERRGESTRTLDKRLAMAQRHYDEWPWAKLTIIYEAIGDATTLFRQPPPPRGAGFF